LERAEGEVSVGVEAEDLGALVAGEGVDGLRKRREFFEVADIVRSLRSLLDGLPSGGYGIRKKGRTIEVANEIH
jgi:hypothetical protein